MENIDAGMVEVYTRGEEAGRIARSCGTCKGENVALRASSGDDFSGIRLKPASQAVLRCLFVL